tara:strand:- start:31842 stop:32075 length:234 start_codon:yes stop_codon:yes gene_type:complete
MQESNLSSLKRYIAEETCHHKFGENAVTYNTSTGEFEFTDHSQHFIETEIDNLDMIFETYGCKPKFSLTKTIKTWLK